MRLQIYIVARLSVSPIHATHLHLAHIKGILRATSRFVKLQDSSIFH